MSKLAVVVLLAAAGVAQADDDNGFAALDKSLVTITPGSGLDKAPVRAPAWCGKHRERDDGWAFNVKDGLEAYRNGQHVDDSPILEVARILCGAPRSRMVERAAAETEQLWINQTGLAEADAVTSLAARIDRDAFDAEREKLCNALGDGGDGDDDDDDSPHHKPNPAVLKQARRELFGCRNQTPLWKQKSNDLDHLGKYVDGGMVERDPLARMAWVLQREFTLVDKSEKPETALIDYIVDQFDLHAVQPDAVMKAVEGAPYANNRYAHVVILESLARAKMRAGEVDDAIAKLSRNATWKELYVTAPQRAAAAWEAAAKSDKDAIAASNEIANGRTPSDCGVLRDHLHAIIKTFKHDDYDAIADQLSDHPLGGLLMWRLSQCLQLKKEPGLALVLGPRDGIRVITGPRMAAYYGAMDAYAKMPEGSRPSWPGRLDILDDALEAEQRTGHAWGGLDTAVIKSVAKKGDTVHVVFVDDKVKVMDQECKESNKIDHITKEGKYVYREVCHDTHLITVDRTPPPADVPAVSAAGLKAGRLVVMYRADGVGSPLVVYTDKTQKHVAAWHGFSFE